MTPAQVKYAIDHLPDVELRRVYPIADLAASVLNVAGGKRDPNDKSAEKPKPPELLFNAFELLPWYARPEWIDGAAAARITQAAAKDFLANRKRVPGWALQLVPLDAVRRIADSN